KTKPTATEQVRMAEIKAVLFDMHGTLVHLENSVTTEEMSDYLFSRGYEVSPQQLRAAWSFVAFIDYPKHGYRSWSSFFSQIFWRLKVKVDTETLHAIVKLLESRPYRLYSDAAEAVPKSKKNGFKTATVTTIAHFQFKKAITPIKKYFDFIMTGYEAGCDKSNPRMYRKVLEALDVKPEEAIMIGDDVQVDILLPKRLGINAILLDREGKSEECSQADAVVNDLNEAVEIIIRKFSRS
ncbi:MAG TPA: HAD family hydrolase, partial [Acidobacteriota bacterium]|nr:HAD family hydrolase [Acidobacteriota bacterium]